MQLKLLDLLACPKCSENLNCEASEADSAGQVIEGRIACAKGHEFPVAAGIPRFVRSDNYAASFGFQWNRFAAEQIDSINGTRLSESRFYAETGWTSDWMSGKWILDVGCGAGRFLDVTSQTGCEVVGVDMSNAIDAARETLAGRTNIHLVQASIYDLPFRSGVFDGCYCIGVIQHTPDPLKAIRALPRVMKKGGRLALTIYELNRWTKLNAKYLIRPVTSRLNKKLLLYAIKGSMPILFPTTEVLFRIPYLRRLFMHAIPVANYVGESQLTMRQRYAWALLDTFDVLSPEYDQPQVKDDVMKALRETGIQDLRRLNHAGLNIVGEKTDLTD